MKIVLGWSIGCIINKQYIYYTEDGITLFRKGVRNSYFIVDKTLTSTGFSGIEGTDWVNIKLIG